MTPSIVIASAFEEFAVQSGEAADGPRVVLTLRQSGKDGAGARAMMTRHLAPDVARRLAVELVRYADRAAPPRHVRALQDFVRAAASEP